MLQIYDFLTKVNAIKAAPEGKIRILKKYKPQYWVTQEKENLWKNSCMIYAVTTEGNK